MSNLSDFYTRFPPPPVGSPPGSWQYVADNPAPVRVPEGTSKPILQINWKELRMWIGTLTGLGMLMTKLFGLFRD